MTKKEIIKKNKIILEEILLYYEFYNSELLNLFDTISIISYDFLYELYQLIPESGFELEYKKMDIKDSINLVRDFLRNIDEKYVNIFDRSLNDGVFELFLIEDDLVERPTEPVIYPKPEASIYIPVQNNIKDGSIIIHEFFHYLNDNGNIGLNRYIFTEMISIYFEFRYCQYLVTKGISRNAFNQEVCERLDDTLIASDKLTFTSSILDIYYNTGEINKKNINFLNKFREINGYDKNDIINFYHDPNFDDEISQFESDISYVIGSLLAFNALNETAVSDIKMKYINENINQMNIKDVFEVLQTDFDEYPNWIKICKENLKKAVSEIYEENYSYSRTNGGR